MTHVDDNARLDTALDELRLEAIEEPANVAAAVMQAIQQLEAARVRPHGDGRISGGGVMTKKALIGLAAAAAAVFAVFLMRGFPPAVDGGEATIGQAARAVTPQMGEADATIGDPEVQQFLQSEVFQTILNDREAVSLLADADLRGRLADSDLRRALTEDGFSSALAALQKDGSLKRMLADTEAVGFLRGRLGAHLNDPAVRAWMASQDLRRQLGSSDVRAALRSGSESALARHVGSADLARYLAGQADLRRFLTNDAVARAMAEPAFVAALRNDAFRASLSNARIADALLRPGLAQSLAKSELRSALRSSSFAAAARSAAFAQQIAAAEARPR